MRYTPTKERVGDGLRINYSSRKQVLAVAQGVREDDEKEIRRLLALIGVDTLRTLLRIPKNTVRRVLKEHNHADDGVVKKRKEA
jgi:hypothetical protein